MTRAISRVIVMTFAVAALVWLLLALRGVLLLVALAILLAYVLAPLVDRACRPVTLRGREYVMPRALAIAVVYLLTFGSLAIGAALLLPLVGTQITQFAQQAPSYLDVARSRLLRWTASYEAYHLPAAIRDAINTSVMHTTELAGQYVTEGLGGVIIQAIGYLPRLLLIPILAFFLLKDSAAFRTMALRILPRGRWRSRGDQVLQDVNATLAVYIRSQLIACLLVGTICTIGFSLIGVPYAIVLGLVAGLLEFIPLVGPLVVALMAVLVASFVSLPQALTVVVFLGIVRIVEDFVIYPNLIGRGMPLHPFAVVVAVLCGADLAGVPGIFLAIPTLAIMSVGHRHWLAHSGSEGLVANLLKSTPKGTPGDNGNGFRTRDAGRGAPHVTGDPVS
jgi:predicted PurR-regulated permease PerM